MAKSKRTYGAHKYYRELRPNNQMIDDKSVAEKAISVVESARRTIGASVYKWGDIRQVEAIVRGVDSFWLFDSPPFPPSSRRKEVSGDKPWFGTKTIDEALDLCRGWDEGARMVSDAMDKISVGLPVGLHTIEEYDVTGCEVDVGLMLSGEPECMRDYYDKPGKRHAITIGVSLSASSFVSPQKFVRRGAHIAALVKWLEDNDVRVGVKAFECCTSSFSTWGVKVGWRGLVTVIDIKKPSDRLHLPTLAFWLAHPSALRRFVFALNERMDPVDVKTMGMSYGRPASLLRAFQSGPLAGAPADVLRRHALSVLGIDYLLDNHSFREGDSGADAEITAAWKSFDNDDSALAWLNQAASDAGLSFGVL